MTDPDAGEVTMRTPGALDPHPLYTEVYDDWDDMENAFLLSLQDQSINQPVVVDRDDVIVSGHKRVAAAREAGFGTVPVRVEEFESDLDRLEALLRNNRDREKTFTQKMQEADALLAAKRDHADRTDDRADRLDEHADRTGDHADGSDDHVDRTADDGQAGEATTDQRGTDEPGTDATSGGETTAEGLDETDADAAFAEEIAETVGFESATTYRRARAVWEARGADDESLADAAREQIERLDGGEGSISDAYSTLLSTDGEADADESVTGDAGLGLDAGGIAEGGSAPMVAQGDAASLPLKDGSVDVIVTSPPYNLHGRWTAGVGDDEGAVGFYGDRGETAYRAWQQRVLTECHRVARHGASLFYVHTVRIEDGEVMHPIEWLGSDENPWTVRQEVVWNHPTEHNDDPSLFRPTDDRIYWLTKGTPSLPEGGVGLDSVWDFQGTRTDTDHPTPFPRELPRRCIEAVATPGDVVLDPMAGAMTTPEVAADLGYPSIGIEVEREFVEDAPVG